MCDAFSPAETFKAMEENKPTNSVLDYAIAEARRIFVPIRALPNTVMAEAAEHAVDHAAITAARRAPGIKAAAEALHALLLQKDESFNIPSDVAKEVSSTTTPSTDVALVARVAKWLEASPHELKRCKNAAAALVVTAPIALFETQLKTTAPDPKLVEQCSQMLHARPERSFPPPSRGKRPFRGNFAPHRTNTRRRIA